MYKTIILFLIAILITSCGTLMVEGETSEHYFNYSPYNYDRVHYIYLNQPNYFQNTLYINEYGQQYYMYNHPHYIRYCRERDGRKRIESRKRPYIKPAHSTSNYQTTNRRTYTNYSTTTRRSTPTTTRRVTPTRASRTKTTRPTTRRNHQ